jgi:hypothetical protein
MSDKSGICVAIEIKNNKIISPVNMDSIKYQTAYAFHIVKNPENIHSNKNKSMQYERNHKEIFIFNS